MVQKVMIVDDHPITRLGVRSVIDKHPKVVCVAEAGDGLEAQHLMQMFEPDILLLDVNMPQMDGRELIQWLAREHASTRVIVLTHLIKDLFEDEAFKDERVVGLMHKSSVLNDLSQAIDTVLEGQFYYSKEFCQLREAAALKAQKNKHKLHLYDRLTKTERKILKLIALDNTSGQIALSMEKSIRTIEYHRYHICQKLEVTGTKGLLVHALTNKNLIARLG